MVQQQVWDTETEPEGQQSTTSDPLASFKSAFKPRTGHRARQNGRVPGTCLMSPKVLLMERGDEGSDRQKDFDMRNALKQQEDFPHSTGGDDLRSMLESGDFSQYESLALSGSKAAIQAPSAVGPDWPYHQKLNPEGYMVVETFDALDFDPEALRE